MEDELWAALYPLVVGEDKRRPRLKRVQYSDAVIVLVSLWAVLHERPVSWACRRRNWPGELPWCGLPSGATMSRRLRTLSVQLLWSQLFWRLLQATNRGPAAATPGREPPLPCLCRRVDSKPLAVGGFSKDRDARWGYATGGKARGYKLFCCWAKRGLVPEQVVLGPLSESDQAGAMQLIDRLAELHPAGLYGYVLADATHDTNPLFDHAASRGLQLVAPRKAPNTGLGHRDHSPHRLRSIDLLEGPGAFGPSLLRLRGQIERDLGNLTAFAGGLQPPPSFVRRPRRVARWVVAKLIINGIRICLNYRLTP